MKPLHTRKQRIQAKVKRRREIRERAIQQQFMRRVLDMLPVPVDPREGY